MKLRPSIIKQIIKEELQRFILEWGQVETCGEGEKWSDESGACVKAQEAAPPEKKPDKKPDKKKVEAKPTEKNVDPKKTVVTKGAGSLRKAINKACFGAKVTNLAAARKANKCPNSNMTYKQWVAGRRAARKGDKRTVEKILSGGRQKGPSAEQRAEMAEAQKRFKDFLAGDRNYKRAFIDGLKKAYKRRPEILMFRYLINYLKQHYERRSQKKAPQGERVTQATQPKPRAGGTMAS